MKTSLFVFDTWKVKVDEERRRGRKSSAPPRSPPTTTRTVEILSMLPRSTRVSFCPLLTLICSSWENMLIIFRFIIDLNRKVDTGSMRRTLHLCADVGQQNTSEEEKVHQSENVQNEFFDWTPVDDQLWAFESISFTLNEGRMRERSVKWKIAGKTSYTGARGERSEQKRDREKRNSQRESFSSLMTMKENQ